MFHKFIALFLAALCILTTSAFAGEHYQSAYDRVMATNTIRCGYFPYAPALIIDPNTKVKSGIFYDITEEIGRRLGLKIEWAEEVDYGVIPEGFRSNRYDMFCNAVWPTPERVREASFSTPLYYSTVGIFVKSNDARFDKDSSKLNTPSVTLAVKDGDITASIAKSLFPRAKFVSVPQMALTQEQLIMVATGKADATFNEPMLLYDYNKTANVKLKDIATRNPIKYFGSTYMLPPNEFQLKHMIDVTLENLLSEGYIDRVIQKYEPFAGAMKRVAKPYEIK
ncbi:MAG: transporter substrate-binding domain-containing protein [Alphaproteobacteria bacterium]|nr:transporter substrate-binding domain-containing protein [Alphaproteobacteria bacterium]